MSSRLITASTASPVTLEDVRAHLRVTATDEDTMIQGLIAAATSHVESYTGRLLMEQTWELVLDTFSDSIMIPKGPVQSVASVKYNDSDGVLRTVDEADYYLDNVSDPAWIVRASDFTWPTPADGVNNVIIRYVAGYVTLSPAIKHAILLLIAHWFDNRGAASERPMTDIPHAVDALLTNHRSYSF